MDPNEKEPFEIPEDGICIMSDKKIPLSTVILIIFTLLFALYFLFTDSNNWGIIARHNVLISKALACLSLLFFLFFSYMTIQRQRKTVVAFQINKDGISRNHFFLIQDTVSWSDIAGINIRENNNKEDEQGYILEIYLKDSDILLKDLSTIKKLIRKHIRKVEKADMSFYVSCTPEEIKRIIDTYKPEEE